VTIAFALLALLVYGIRNANIRQWLQAHEIHDNDNKASTRSRVATRSQIGTNVNENQ
jgi:hypothetical protein